MVIVSQPSAKRTSCVGLRLRLLRSLARRPTPQGVVAVMSDGKHMCPCCIRGSYRHVFQATKTGDDNGYRITGSLYRSDTLLPVHCSTCGERIF